MLKTTEVKKMTKKILKILLENLIFLKGILVGGMTSPEEDSVKL